MANWKKVQPKEKPKKEKKHNMGAKKRKIFVVLPLLVVAVLAIGALVWALPNLPVQPQTQNGAVYKGVMELWNVESFEGGIGSRESWLKNRAAKFEKVNEGLFVHVTTLSVDQLRAKLDEGDCFDMLCFSRGAGVVAQEKLAPLTADFGAVKNNFLLSGQINGLQYALPLYTGVYCLFSRAEMLPQERLLDGALTQTYTRKVGKNSVLLSPLVCGFTPYNSPLSALAMSGGRGKAEVSDTVTQYEAYESFLANRTVVTLLGTQRDMYRLSQKEQNGRIEQLAFAPLGGYTDLVQYVGISATAADKTDACVQFAEYLLSDESQSKLTDLCMFSVLDKTFYTAERYSESELALFKAYVPNVFGDGEAIARQRKMAIDTLV